MGSLYDRSMPMQSWNVFWNVITRLGEAQILLPTALLLALWLARRGHSKRLAITWLLGIAAAASVTTLSKVAFIGYGWGWPAIDFTGVSGHAMFAAAIYPLAGIAVASALAGPHAEPWQRVGLTAGVTLALLVAVSRVLIGVHSWSEVLVGLAVGAVATLVALFAERMPMVRPPLWVPLVFGVWIAITTGYAPPSTTHGLVTRLSLAVSGRNDPYTRGDMHAAWQRQNTLR